MLGITFKENCPDVRNTKIVDVIRSLESYSTQVTIYDPWVNPQEVQHEYGLVCHPELVSGSIFDAVVLGVAHKEFMDLEFDSFRKNRSVLYDVKGIVGNKADIRL